jgi:hypothetical protein
LFRTASSPLTGSSGSPREEAPIVLRCDYPEATDAVILTNDGSGRLTPLADDQLLDMPLASLVATEYSRDGRVDLVSFRLTQNASPSSSGAQAGGLDSRIPTCWWARGPGCPGWLGPGAKPSGRKGLANILAAVGPGPLARKGPSIRSVDVERGVDHQPASTLRARLARDGDLLWVRETPLFHVRAASDRRLESS